MLSSRLRGPGQTYGESAHEVGSKPNCGSPSYVLDLSDPRLIAEGS